MENAELTENDNRSKRNLKRSGGGSHLSISDVESITSWHSPLRSDDPSPPLENDGSDDRYSKALVLVNNYCSPTNSNSPESFPAEREKGRRRNPHPKETQKEIPDFPTKSPEKHRLIDHLSESIDFPEEKNPSPDFPASSPSERGSNAARKDHRPLPSETPTPASPNFTSNETSLVVVEVNQLQARNEQQPIIAKNLRPIAGEDEEENRHGGVSEEEAGGDKQSRAAVDSILRRSKRKTAVKKAALAFRIFEAVACLVSFSVMAADKTQGWSGDSFYRYKEYRYCLSVNVIAFLYSSFQAFDVSYHLFAGKQFINHNLRFHFDFSMDQLLAYLLMSSSSSAATRVYDWTSNWGVDEFTFMASASISMSFLAFLAFAFSCLVSGYNLCNREFA